MGLQNQKKERNILLILVGLLSPQNHSFGNHEELQLELKLELELHLELALSLSLELSLELSLSLESSK